MPFVMGQCPECKKILPVDDTQEKWVCGYCESRFSVAETVKNFNMLINVTSINNNHSENKNIYPVTDISDFEIRDNTIIKYKGKSSHVVIPKSIKSIERSAFEYCVSLESVVLPEHLVFIPRCAFAGCTALKSVIIPESVNSIGIGAFMECKSLESVKIPERVISIVDSAFKGCSSLKTITIPESVRYIGRLAFEDCMSLKSVKIPDKFKTYSRYIFGYRPDLKIEYY